MTSLKNNRLDPSTLTLEQLSELENRLQERGTPEIVDGTGKRTKIPQPIYEHLLQVIRTIKAGKAVLLLPEDETFTTQAAADYLGMSRQFLVTLLEQGSIPFHKVGSHRRVYFRDLLVYQEKRDQNRKKVLQELNESIIENDLYFPQ